MKNRKFSNVKNAALMTLPLTVVLPGAAYSQIRPVQMEGATIKQLPPLIAVVPGVSAPGHMLFAEFETNRFRVWSIDPNGNGQATAPQWITVAVNGTAAINVNTASGLYMTTRGTVGYKTNITGSFQTANMGQYGSATLLGFGSPITLSTGAIPTAPAAFVQSGVAQISALEATAAGTAMTPTALRAFHALSMQAGVKAHKALETALFGFVERATSDLAARYDRVQQLRQDAMAVLNVLGTNNSGTLNGGAIVNLSNQFQQNAQQDQASAQTAANSAQAQEANVQVAINQCQGQAERLRRLQAELQNQVNAAFDERDKAHNNDTEPDTQPNTDALEAALEEGSLQLELCLGQIAATYEQMDENGAPQPQNLNDYMVLEQSAEALGNAMVSAADAYAAATDPDQIEAQFGLSAETYLGFQRTILQELRPTDTTGSIQAELNDIATIGTPVLDTATAAVDHRAHIRNIRPVPVGEIGSVQTATATATPEVATRSSSMANAKAAASPLACEQNSVPNGFSFNMLNVSFVLGTPFNDRLVGGAQTDIMLGLGGDDCILGRDGHDIAFGMKGNDDIMGEGGHDFLFGNRGEDHISGGVGKKYTFSIGTVTFDVWLGNVMSGGANNDSLYGLNRTPTGADTPNDQTNQFVDIMFGDGLAKTALHGDDLIDGQSGINFIFGQSGADDLRADKAGKFQINGVPIPLGSFYFGQGGNDVISGSNGIDFGFGNIGDDTMTLGDRIDFAFGGKGKDNIDGGAGLDILFGNADDDKIEGGSGAGAALASQLNIPLLDADLIFGNDGNDVITDAGGQFGLAFGNKDNDSIKFETGINGLFGNLGEDWIVGADNAASVELLFGNDGNDGIGGRGGIDIAFGNAGRDIITGGLGIIDALFGNIDADLVAGAAQIDGGADGINLLWGNTGDDVVEGRKGVVFAWGNDGNDIVRGGDGPLGVLWGNVGRDCIDGEGGVDFAFGNDGVDMVRGGGGLDILFGGAGQDTFNGGDGSDLIFSDDLGEQIDIGTGALNFVVGRGGDDQVTGQGGGLIIGGDGADRVHLTQNLALVIGGNGADQIRTPNGSLLFGGADDDLLFNAFLAVGGAGNDHLDNVGIGLGGNGNDRVRSGTSFALLFGGPGSDDMTTAAGGLVLGGADADRIEASFATGFVFGGGGDDTIDANAANGEDRDFVFGGAGSDGLFGNSNKRDWLVSGSKTRNSDAAAPALPVAAGTLPASFGTTCPTPKIDEYGPAWGKKGELARFVR